MPRSNIRTRHYDLRSDITPPTQGENFKRLIILCDGTWVDANAGSPAEGDNPPSNVTRLSRAIQHTTASGTKQIIYYSPGVGSSGNLLTKIYNGGTGAGLSENVEDAYSFLSQNYEPGDEIFLFGFSRGAFTARAIGGLIAEVGVLTRKGEEYFSDIYTDVRHRNDRDYRPVHPNRPFRNKPSASDPRYSAELARLGLTMLGVRIKVVGVWETVGSLGVPRFGWLEKLGLQSALSKEMQFYDTTLAPCVENAFHALGLDEHRAAFSPTLWQLDDSNKTTKLRQVWFPGVHTNLGGGYPDQSISNITLAWMVAQIEPFLAIDLDKILDEQEKTDDWYEKNGHRPAPWSFGKIYNSLSGIWILGGSALRTPGQYDKVTAKGATNEPLQQTNEYIHSSLRCRIKLKGPAATGESGTYRPPAMKDWKLVIEERAGRACDIFWQFKTNGRVKEMPEAPLAPLEKELLEMCAEDNHMEDYVLHPADVQQQGRSRSASRRR